MNYPYSSFNFSSHNKIFKKMMSKLIGKFGGKALVLNKVQIKLPVMENKFSTLTPTTAERSPNFINRNRRQLINM